MSRRRIALIGWADSVHVQRWAIGLKDTFDLSVFSPGGSAVEGVATKTYPVSGAWGYLRHEHRLKRDLASFSPHLVHAHYATGPAYWGMRCGKKPLVVSVWGSDVEVTGKSPVGHAVVGRFLDRADAITCTSHYLKRVTAELFPHMEGKLHVIPFGIPFPGECAPWPQSNRFRLICPKLHLKVYGTDVLIHALATLVKTGHDVEATLPGVGSETARLKKLAVSLNLQDRLTFPGFIPRTQISALMEAHHAVITPSRRESFGMALLDAASVGRPVVASNVGGIPEIVHNDVTGILVPPDNPDALAAAIASLISDTDRARQMGQVAYRMLREKYRWQDSLDSMATLYHSLIDAQPSKS